MKGTKLITIQFTSNKQNKLKAKLKSLKIIILLEIIILKFIQK